MTQPVMQPVTGRFTAADQVSTPFQPFRPMVGLPMVINLTLWRDDNLREAGFGLGDIAVQRSFDRGVTWHDVWMFSEVLSRAVEETEDGVWYRLLCARYGSIPINYRLSQ